MFLALDQATRTGWAVGCADTHPRSGHFTLPKTGKDIGSFILAYRDELSGLLDEHRPETVFFEQPVLPRQTSIVTLRKLYGIASETEALCISRQIRVREVPVRDWQPYFLGSLSTKGLSKKQRKDQRLDKLYSRCARNGWKFANEDEATALAILDFAMNISSS